MIANTTIMADVEDFKGEVVPMFASERPLELQIKRDPEKTKQYE